MTPAQVKEAMRLAVEQLTAVLCDPEGNAAIRGSDGDLAEIDAALAMLRTLAAQPQTAAERLGVTPYSTLANLRTDEELALYVQEHVRIALAEHPSPMPMLSDEQIDAITRSAVGEAHSAYRKIARAILAAAGAKQAVAPTPLTDDPKVGETWHILRQGATACATVTIEEVTKHTVVFKPTIYGLDPERLPRNGVKFVERAHGIASKPAEPTP